MKLSGGRNEIVIDKWLQKSWSSSPNGRLKLRRKTINNVNGFLIERGEL